ncbi:MAG: hypothetical protein ACOC7X_14155 [Spirochaetota bacterium]
MRPTDLSLNQLLENLSPAKSPDEWAQTVCRITSQLSGSSLTAFYTTTPNTQELSIQAKIGHTAAAKHISQQSGLFQAAAGCQGAVLQNSASGPFPELLLNEGMQSGIAVLLELGANLPTHSKSTGKTSLTGLLIANYSAPYHYTGNTIALFEQVRTLFSFTPQGKTSGAAKKGSRASGGKK